MQFTIDKGVTSVGIVSDSVPTWAWFVEGLGSLKWIVSRRDIPGRMEGDPPWFTTYESISGRREVEVVLVQGAWECVPEQVWSSKSVRVILRVNNFVSKYGNSQERSRGWNKARKRKKL